MALIVTPGAINANSYAALAEANSYHEGRLHNADWTSASDVTKESAMIWATRLIDDNMSWQRESQRTTKEQSLDWPRFGIIDKDWYSIDSDAIPVNLKYAQSELAFLLIGSDRTISDESPASGIKKAKISVMEVEFNPDDRKLVLSTSVISYLQEFGTFSGVSANQESQTLRVIRT